MALRELGQDLVSIEDVRTAILEHISPLESELRSLEEAFGAVLRDDLIASESIPPFDNSAMDGFAVRVEDLAAASPDHPLELPVQGGLAAGKDCESCLARLRSRRSRILYSSISPSSLPSS